MISSKSVVDQLCARGFGPFLGVPDSILKPFINYVIDQPDLDYFAANNEGEAIAIAAGTYLAGKLPVVMLQNSGLGNTVNPLTSLAFTFRIPMLLVVTWRGEPGKTDAPQHELMGRITPDLLTLMGIEHHFFPETEEEIAPKIETATRYISNTGLPYAFILRKGLVENYNPHSNRDTPAQAAGQIVADEPPANRLLSRWEAIGAIVAAAADRAFLVATTGKTGRELFTRQDGANHFYMVGSMGCASSLGLGVALYQPGAPTIVLDGDGAALMRLEAMASIGHYRPGNFIHIILDNGTYDSTGGQRTLSAGVRFPEMAIACGYRTAGTICGEAGLVSALESSLVSQGPHLIHLRIRPGSTPDLGRPTLSMPDIAARFRECVTGYHR